MPYLLDEFTPPLWPEWLEITNVEKRTFGYRSYYLTKFEEGLYLIYRRDDGRLYLCTVKPDVEPPYLFLGLGWTTIAEWPAATSRQTLMTDFPATLMEALL